MTEESRRANLEKIEHIVVLMLENRAFDHMLGYRSVPGATWPNRLYGICGRAAGSRDDLPLNLPPLYDQPSFVRHLDACGKPTISASCSRAPRRDRRRPETSSSRTPRNGQPQHPKTRRCSGPESRPRQRTTSKSA